MDTIEPLDPDGRLAPIDLRQLVFFGRLRGVVDPAYAVGVVGLVIEDQDITLASHVTAQDPGNHRCVRLPAPLDNARAHATDLAPSYEAWRARAYQPAFAKYLDRRRKRFWKAEGASLRRLTDEGEIGASIEAIRALRAGRFDGDPIQHHLPDEIRNAVVVEDEGAPIPAADPDPVAEADPDADAIATAEPATAEDEADAEAAVEAESEAAVEPEAEPEAEAEAEVPEADAAGDDEPEA